MLGLIIDIEEAKDVGVSDIHSCEASHVSSHMLFCPSVPSDDGKGEDCRCGPALSSRAPSSWPCLAFSSSLMAAFLKTMIQPGGQFRTHGGAAGQEPPDLRCEIDRQELPRAGASA